MTLRQSLKDLPKDSPNEFFTDNLFIVLGLLDLSTQVTSTTVFHKYVNLKVILVNHSINVLNNEWRGNIL